MAQIRAPPTSRPAPQRWVSFFERTLLYSLREFGFVSAKEKLDIVSGAALPRLHFFAGTLRRSSMRGERRRQNGFALIQAYRAPNRKALPCGVFFCCWCSAESNSLGDCYSRARKGCLIICESLTKQIIDNP